MSRAVNSSDTYASGLKVCSIVVSTISGYLEITNNKDNNRIIIYVCKEILFIKKKRFTCFEDYI